MKVNYKAIVREMMQEAEHLQENNLLIYKIGVSDRCLIKYGMGVPILSNKKFVEKLVELGELSPVEEVKQ